ncbi:hypothetical protein [Lacticaseibacillus sharpeae]|nr:hypothetical protein [Lacticaseibacillus sharpeae]
MEYLHIVMLGGDHSSLFAYDFASPITTNQDQVSDTMAASLTSIDRIGVSDHIFRLDERSTDAVRAYDPYFEQFAFVPTWAEFLQRVADWNHITLPQDSPAIQAAIELLDKDDSHVDSEKGAAEA